MRVTVLLQSGTETDLQLFAFFILFYKQTIVGIFSICTSQTKHKTRQAQHGHPYSITIIIIHILFLPHYSINI